MPTKYRNPRILVAFKPHEFEVIKRLAAVTSTTMSKAVHGQLEAVLPIIEKVVATLEAAKEMEGLPRAKLLAGALKLHAEMDGVAAHALDQFDMFRAAATGSAAALGASVATAPTASRQDVRDTTRRHAKASTRTPPKPSVSRQGTRTHARRGK